MRIIKHSLRYFVGKRFYLLGGHVVHIVLIDKSGQQITGQQWVDLRHLILGRPLGTYLIQKSWSFRLGRNFAFYLFGIFERIDDYSILNQKYIGMTTEQLKQQMLPVIKIERYQPVFICQL